MSENTRNSVTWWEIPVADLAAAQEFYGAVFGWAFNTFGDGYAAATLEGQMIGGLQQAPADVHASAGPRLYVYVDDLDATLAKVGETGGTTVQEPEEIGGDMGWWASFRAPDGQLVGLCADGPSNASGT